MAGLRGKGVSIVVVIAAAAALLGCATNPVVTSGCAYPDDARVLAPAWICGGGEGLTVVAMDDHVGGGTRLSRDRAIEKAKGMMIDRMRDRVAAAARAQLDADGKLQAEVRQRIVAAAVEAVRPGSVAGATLLRISESPARVVYVQFGMGNEAAELEVKAALEAAFIKNPVLFDLVGERSRFLEGALRTGRRG